MEPDTDLPLRITVRHPPSGVAVAMQRGRAELLLPSISTPDLVVFDFTVRLGETAAGVSPRFLGPFTQGPPAVRFVYVNSGKRAGQPGSRWERRAKIPLGGITAALIQAAARTPSGCIETEYSGTGADGGPTCATVKAIVWRVASDPAP